MPDRRSTVWAAVRNLSGHAWPRCYLRHARRRSERGRLMATSLREPLASPVDLARIPGHADAAAVRPPARQPFADGWHAVAAPGGYEWWYFDAEDPATDTQLVAIFMEGFVFHPGYIRAYELYRRRPTRVAPPLPATTSAATSSSTAAGGSSTGSSRSTRRARSSQRRTGSTCASGRTCVARTMRARFG